MREAIISDDDSPTISLEMNLCITGNIIPPMVMTIINEEKTHPVGTHSTGWIHTEECGHPHEYKSVHCTFTQCLGKTNPPNLGIFQGSLPPLFELSVDGGRFMPP